MTTEVSDEILILARGYFLQRSMCHTSGYVWETPTNTPQEQILLASYLRLVQCVLTQVDTKKCPVDQVITDKPLYSNLNLKDDGFLQELIGSKEQLPDRVQKDIENMKSAYLEQYRREQEIIASGQWL